MTQKAKVPRIYLSIFFVALLVIGRTSSSHAQKSELTIEGVRTFDIISNPFTGVYDAMRTERSVKWRLQLPDEQIVVMDLVPSDIVPEHYEVSGVRESAEVSRALALRGWTEEGREVRLTVAPNMAYGYIEVANDAYWFEPLWYHDADAYGTHDVVIYRASDVDLSVPGGCGVHHAHEKREGIQAQTFGQIQSRMGQCYEIELAIASDFSMFTKYGSAADVENRNIGVINNVNGDYSGAFQDDLVFVIVTQFISNCSTCDPWTNSTNANTLLDDFTDWGIGGGFGVNFDVGQLWTDRNFNGSTIGLAWVGTVCRTFRYHVLEDFTANAQFIRVLTSHEIGHNLDADHVNGNFIMAPMVSAATAWSPITVASIDDYIDFMVNVVSCLDVCALPGDPPVAAFESSHTNVCVGTPVEFIDVSTENPDSWTWTFTGGTPVSSAEQHPTVTYNAPGTYQVSLQVQNAFGQDAEVINGYITVGAGEELVLYEDFDLGSGDWSVDNPDNGRTWEAVTALFAPSGEGVMRMDNQNYTMGQRDGLISPEINLIGRTSARMTIDYAYALRPGVSFSDSLLVYVSTDAGVTFDRVFGISENGSGNMATATPVPTFLPEGLDEWCLQSTFSSACLEVDLSGYVNEREVVVRIENYSAGNNPVYIDRISMLASCFSLAPPQARFIADDVEGCAPHLVRFSDQSTNFPATYEWTFPGGNPSTSTDANPLVLYNNPGQYTVTLRVTNEVGNDQFTETNYIVVLDEPVAAFTFSDQNDGIQFTNLSSSALTYQWTFGDGTSAQQPSPFHEYTDDGEYVVQLRVENECGSDIAMDTISIQTEVGASFLSPVRQICAPEDITFINQSSTNVTDFVWQFEGGTPSTSTEEEPTVTYTTPGTYDVRLIASNASFSDTLLLEDYIEVRATPEPDITFTRIDFLSFEMSYSGTPYDSIRWTLPDGSIRTGTNSVIISADDYNDLAIRQDYQVWVQNTCGEASLTELFNLDLPYAALGSLSRTVCVGDEEDFLLFSLDGVNISWLSEGGTPMTGQGDSLRQVFFTADTFELYLTIQEGSAMNTDTFIIVVVDDPVADFIDDGIDLTNQSLNATSYTWVVDGIVVSMEENYTLPQAAGSYDVLLIAQNACGVDSIAREIQFSSTGRSELNDGFKMYPNPTSGRVVFERESSGMATLRIFTMDGRFIRTRAWDSGSQQLAWHLELASGVYLILIEEEGRPSIVNKLVLTNGG